MSVVRSLFLGWRGTRFLAVSIACLSLSFLIVSPMAALAAAKTAKKNNARAISPKGGTTNRKKSNSGDVYAKPLPPEQIRPETRWPFTVWPNEGAADRPQNLAEQIQLIDPEAVALALADMAATWPGRFDAAAQRARLGDLAARRAAALRALQAGGAQAAAQAAALLADVRAALLANPLLDFDRLLLVRRAAATPRLALPGNWESDSSLPRTGIDNDVAILSGLRGPTRLDLLFQPERGKFVGDLTLHFDAGRLLFSSIMADGRWGVFELDLGNDPHRLKAELPNQPRPLPLIPDSDVDNYSACYLPDDSVIFSSTAPFIGVPCVRGNSHVCHLYRFWPATGKIRRLTFDQEHNWCPTPLPDGRILYLRWEYADLPHYVGRILFTMNPDGTGQREFYGSNSYWPNSFFYAKPMPGHPRKVAGIVTGHHGVTRMGELLIVDPALGRHETGGVVQRIPGRGKKVEPRILDHLVDDSWPKFLHPAPLSDKYILTACKPTTTSLWGIYLVDVFDNLTLIREESGLALLEPVPLRKTPRPPVIPDAVKENEKTARMQIVDIYQGPGLAGVPRGTIKNLRLIAYTFSYQGMGGQIDRVGLDGPWDVKRVLGTVPVEADGSANFIVPACLPIAMQPLDAQGRAVALMRSWTTAMPGETQSCLGCHERQNSVSAVNKPTLAIRQPPAQITPFYGPLRGFSFDREVQPVLDRYCVSCHDGQPRAVASLQPPASSLQPLIPDFTRRPHVFAGSALATYNTQVMFPPAYLALKAFVRTPTMESDMHLLPPADFHASTTELIQRLDAGHYGVRLDPEAWDRLVTWIDLNTPAHGTWTEIAGDKRMAGQGARRRELLLRYAGLDDNPEAIYPGPSAMPAEAHREAALKRAEIEKKGAANPPAEAGGKKEPAQSRLTNTPTSMSLDLGEGVTMTFMRIPAGQLIASTPSMPSTSATPSRAIPIPRPFWIGACEVTNAQYARFDPAHDSRLENGDFLQFSERERGYPLNAPGQPVCRVSWRRADAFCAWLAARAGRPAALPTGAQWEYACRAGADTIMSYGRVEDDFSRDANLADANLRFVETLNWGLPSGAVPPWRPAAEAVNDGFRVSAPAGSFRPNAWGLYDMHGNVWEWTRDLAGDGVKRLAHGGSWYSRPQRATATLAYDPWQPVYDVGFRVMAEDTKDREK